MQAMRDFRKELVVKREQRRAQVGRLTDDCVQGRLLGADDRREKRREELRGHGFDQSQIKQNMIT